MKLFTYYWNREQLLAGMDRVDREGTSYPISYTGGSGFEARGV